VAHLRLTMILRSIKRGLSALVCAVICIAAVVSALTYTAVPLCAAEEPVIERARHAYLYNIENERLLYTYNADELIFPASMVKIMTAVLAIEHLGDRWNEVVAVPEEAVQASRGQASKISLKVGEELTIGDLISSVIVGGANDSSYALAMLVSGNIDRFVNLMNQRAEELGMLNTHFTNPTGVHDDRMSTTMQDMATLCVHAYHLQRFTDASKLERYNIGATNKTRGTRYIVNKNYFVSNTVKYKYYNPEVVGMNAGFTYEAGSVVVAVAAREGVTQLCIVTGGEIENIMGVDPETGLEIVTDTTDYSYITAQNLLDWAFENYAYIDILSPARIICEIPVKMSGKADHVTLLPENGITEYMPNDIDPTHDIMLDWTLDVDYLTAPVERGQAVGELTLYYEGEVLETVRLVAQNTVDRDEGLYLFSAVMEFVTHPGFVALVCIVIFMAVVYVFAMAYLRERRRRKRKRDRQIMTRMK